VGASTTQRASDRIDELRDAFVAGLATFVSQPSVSATGEGIRDCAGWLAGQMRELGIAVEVLETGGQPLVYGRIGQGAPRLVVYGHYDVQPAGPLDAWVTPPFEPAVRDGAMYGRGVGDNKGQLLAHLYALRAWLDVHGEPPPFELVFVFDGEEEIGSPATEAFIEAHPERFRGDYVVCADGSTLGVPGPAIFLAIRGLLYLELTARGAPAGWASGSYGGFLPNPVQRVAAAVASLVDARGHVLVEGFYAGAAEPTDELRALGAALPADFVGGAAAYGVERFIHERPLDAMLFEPHISACGIDGGYTGEGVMMTVPAAARAKLDVTFVSGQSADALVDRIREHLDRHGFEDVELDALMRCGPIALEPRHELVELVAEASASVWGERPVLIPSIAGGGPFAAFAETLGVPTLVVPYAQHDLHEHSPDEHLRLDWYRNGIKTSAALYARLAARGA